MKLLYSCIIAISMYSRIPVPQIQWTKERMKHALCFFPLVGLIQGLFLALWLWLAEEVFRLSPAMTGLWAAALPVLITGGIHMDGFLDTMDGVCSYGDREKKLEILKDPHLGLLRLSIRLHICSFMPEPPANLQQGQREAHGCSLCFL